MRPCARRMRDSNTMSPTNLGFPASRKVSSVQPWSDGHFIRITSASSGLPIRRSRTAKFEYELPIRSLLFCRRMSMAFWWYSAAFSKSGTSVYAIARLFRLKAIKGSVAPSFTLRIASAALNGSKAAFGLFMSRSMSPRRSVALANARDSFSGNVLRAVVANVRARSYCSRSYRYLGRLAGTASHDVRFPYQLQRNKSSPYCSGLLELISYFLAIVTSQLTCGKHFSHFVHACIW